MAEIDVGSPAIGRASFLSFESTCIDLNNAANDTGTIDTVQVFGVSGYNIVAATFTTCFLVSGTTYETRDSEYVGNITSGSMQEFTGLDIDIEAGDFNGIHATSGRIERDYEGFTNDGQYMGEAKDPTDQASYDIYAGDAISLYGTGETVGVTEKFGTDSGTTDDVLEG